MITFLLPVGAPPIFRPAFGRGVLVDFGGITPVPFATFDAAAAEIAALMSVPPVGPSGSTRTPVVATADVAGSDPTVAAPPAAGGQVPEPPAYASPGDEDGSGTTYSRAAEAVGPAARVHPSKNGAVV